MCCHQKGAEIKRTILLNVYNQHYRWLCNFFNDLTGFLAKNLLALGYQQAPEVCSDVHLCLTTCK